MAKRKMFDRGQSVEVQRDPGAKWEPATYERAYGDDIPGHHSVRLRLDSPPRFIDSMTGMECSPGETRAYRTHHLCVPSRRIRREQREG